MDIVLHLEATSVQLYLHFVVCSLRFCFNDKPVGIFNIPPIYDLSATPFPVTSKLVDLTGQACS